METRDGQLLELLKAVAGGDHAALRRLDRQVRPALLRHARGICRQRYDCEEVVQAALIAIWRGAAGYDPALAAPLTWMCTIVRNLACDQWRRATAARRAEVFDGAGDADGWLAASVPSPCERLEVEQELAAVLGRVSRLAPDQRDALEWTWLHGLTHIEAASRMDRPLGTVKTLVRRGLLTIRAAHS